MAHAQLYARGVIPINLFYSKKFWRKVHFIPTLQDLSEYAQLDEQYIPAAVTAKDKLIMSRRPTSRKYMTQSADTTVSEQSSSEGRESASSEKQGQASVTAGSRPNQDASEKTD